MGWINSMEVFWSKKFIPFVLVHKPPAGKTYMVKLNVTQYCILHEYIFFLTHYFWWLVIMSKISQGWAQGIFRSSSFSLSCPLLCKRNGCNKAYQNWGKLFFLTLNFMQKNDWLPIDNKDHYCDHNNNVIYFFTYFCLAQFGKKGRITELQKFLLEQKQDNQLSQSHATSKSALMIKGVRKLIPVFLRS